MPRERGPASPTSPVCLDSDQAFLSGMLRYMTDTDKPAVQQRLSLDAPIPPVDELVNRAPDQRLASATATARHPWTYSSASGRGLQIPCAGDPEWMGGDPPPYR